MLGPQRYSPGKGFPSSFQTHRGLRPSDDKGHQKGLSRGQPRGGGRWQRDDGVELWLPKVPGGGRSQACRPEKGL